MDIATRNTCPVTLWPLHGLLIFQVCDYNCAELLTFQKVQVGRGAAHHTQMQLPVPQRAQSWQ